VERGVREQFRREETTRMTGKKKRKAQKDLRGGRTSHSTCRKGTGRLPPAHGPKEILGGGEDLFSYHLKETETRTEG